MRDKLNDIAILIVNIIAIVMLAVFMVLFCKAIFSKPEKCELEPPKLPKIDREAALELLERGECIGGEIEEAKFTVWICKE